MSDWGEGYVSDLEYVPGYYPLQAPGLLNLATLVAGYSPLPLDSGFRYCELGCGLGYTTALLAAADPRGEYWACDFNPAHIARARELIAGAGLGNVTFEEASFADLVGPNAPDLPKFDVVTMHGVYSWINRENQQAILRFLDRHVVPGGIVYVTYNCMPGWSSMLPLQRMLIEYANLAADRSDARFGEAASFARDLIATGTHVLKDVEGVDKILKGTIVTGGERQTLGYLVHEYLNQSWQPLYHADVARDMATAKLNYVGPASLLEQFRDLSFSTEQRALLDRIGRADVRETFGDYCLPRQFRTDIYVRGAARLSEHRRNAMLRETAIALQVPADAVKLSLTMPAGEVTLNEASYRPVIDALIDRGACTLGELAALPQAHGGNALPPLEIAGMLVGSRQAFPAVAFGQEAAQSVRRFNTYAIDRIADEPMDTMRSLAAPLTASGLGITGAERLMIDALRRGVPEEEGPLGDWLAAAMDSRGETVMVEGKPLVESAEQREFAGTRVKTFLGSTLPVLRRLHCL